MQLSIFNGKCFRPLTGIVILNNIETEVLIMKFEKGFRPLTGIVILNNDRQHTTRKEWDTCPSPYGDCDS